MELNGFKEIGNKYFRYTRESDDDSLVLIRVTGIQNKNVVRITYLKSEDKSLVGTSTKMKVEDLKKNYTRLLSNGFIVFSVVSVPASANTDEMAEDVLVTLYRRSEMEAGLTQPFAACRQNITDFFYTYISEDPDRLFVGVSVSRDSCPDNIDFDVVTSCSGINMALGVNVYIDDSLDTILSMFSNKKFDATILSIYEDRKKDIEKYLGRKIETKENESLDGYCSSLRSLLVDNDFMFDFNQAFNITPIDMEIIPNEDGSLPAPIVITLSHIFKKNITKTVVIEFAEDIDVEQLNMHHFILRDKNQNIFIVGFTEGDEYIEEEMVQKSCEDIKAAYSHILINKNKYCSPAQV